MIAGFGALAATLPPSPTPTLFRISCCHDDVQHLDDLWPALPVPCRMGGAPRSLTAARADWTLGVCAVWTALPLYEVLVGVKGVQRAEPPPV